MEKKSKFKIYSMGESLLFAIFFLLLGIILITNPKAIIKTILYVIATFSIIISVFKLLLYYKMTDYVKDNKNKNELIKGIVMLLFGAGIIVSTTVFYDKVVSILVLVLSIYLLYVGIVRIVQTFKVNKNHRIPFIINASIVTLIGLILLFFPNLPFIVIGIFLIIYSITEIFGVTIDKDKTTSEDIIKEAEIISVVEHKEIEDKEK